jgi:RNA polymerase sigma factor (sigma-70 family)
MRVDPKWTTAVKSTGADTLKTQPTLLSRVRRGDEEGWTRFYAMYENFIYSCGRAAGLTPEESRDLVQETMITVQHYITHFVPDPHRGKFRTWLRTIVQSRIADQFRKKKSNPLEKSAAGPIPDDSTQTSTTHRIPNVNEVELDRLIDGQLEQAILSEARRITKEMVAIEQYQAYDLFDVQELSAGNVALSLGISPVAVRVRACRVRQCVKRQARRIAAQLERRRPGAR